MRFDLTDLALKSRLRRGLMKRGSVLATLLADVLAGRARPPSLGTMGIVAKPGIRPEEALRQALDAVEERRRLLDADDDRFGRCDICGTDLGEAALGELPWADRCQAHASS